MSLAFSDDAEVGYSLLVEMPASHNIYMSTSSINSSQQSITSKYIAILSITHGSSSVSNNGNTFLP